MPNLHYRFTNMKCAQNAAEALKLQGFCKVYLDINDSYDGPNLSFPHRHNVHSLSATISGANHFLYNVGKGPLTVSDPYISGLSYLPFYDIESKLIVEHKDDNEKATIDSIVIGFLENS